VNMNVAFIGDESGTFYAVNIQDGSIVWTKELGYLTNSGCNDLPDGQFGVGSTAVFDRTAGVVYAMGGVGVFFALSMRDGNTIWSIASVVDPAILRNYGALNLYRNVIYLTFASYCDIGNYQGKVVTISLTSRKVTHSFTPANGPAGTGYYGGGVWGAGGVSIGFGLRNNSIYFATGNLKNGPSESSNYCDKPVQLNANDLSLINTSPDLSTLVGDDDFGATPVFFNKYGAAEKSGCSKQLLAVERKDGRLLILDANTLQVLQTFQMMTPTSNGQFVSSPAWDPDSSMLIVSLPRDLQYTLSFIHGVVGFKLRSDCSLIKVWNTAVGQSNSGDGNYVFSPPVIAGPVGKRVVFVGTGFWNSLHALSLLDGTLLWSVNLDGYASSAAVFGAATVVNGTVLVGGWDYGTTGRILYAFR